MTDSQKKIVALVSTLFLVCACCGGPIFWSGVAFTSSISTNPAEMQQITNAVASYTLPEGYTEIFVANFTGNKVITIVDNEQGPNIIIWMMLMPPLPEGDIDQFENQMHALMKQFNLQSVNFQQENIEVRTVNQRKTKIIHSTGPDSNGTRQRQMRLFFKSSQGTVFMMAQGPEDKWDQASIEQLLDSIK